MFDFEKLFGIIVIFCIVIIVGTITFSIIDYQKGMDIELEYTVLEKHYVAPSGSSGTGVAGGRVIFIYSASPAEYILILNGPLNSSKENFGTHTFNVDLTVYAKTEVNKNVTITKRVGKYSNKIWW